MTGLSQGKPRERGWACAAGSAFPAGLSRLACASQRPSLAGSSPAGGPVHMSHLQKEETSCLPRGSGEGSDPKLQPGTKVNAIRRRGWASLRKKVKPGTGIRNVVGAGMERNRDRRDRGRPRPLRPEPSTPTGTGAARATKHPRAVEESERLIVAATPGESREQRRGRSRVRDVREPCASDRQRTE